MSARVYCAELRLTRFRNHADTRLSLDSRPVCVFGPNGAGKTNLIEALTMLVPGRGLRGAGMLEMAQGGEAAGPGHAWVVGARVVVEGVGAELAAAAEASPDRAAKRVLRLDGRPASAAALARALRLAWVTPAQDRLFAASPGDRRRFLDRLAYARAPEHATAAAGYERALRERQRLLDEGRAEPGWLSGLEREMAAHGAAVAAARVETVSLLSAAIAARPEDAFPKAEIALEGALEARFAAGEASAAVEAWFVEALRETRRRDAAAGRASLGPHRADLDVRHAGKAMPAAQCSTGEQKALLLGLMLAHAEALAGEQGPPILLFDEAGAHLDPERRAALFDALARLPGQSWLTGTDAAAFSAFGPRAQHFQVEDGCVRAA